MRLSSSKLPLLRECAWWARPEAVWDDRPGAEAIFGNAVHKVAELAISGVGRPPGAALGLVDVAAVAKEHELDAGAAAKLARVAVHLLAFLEANIRPGWVAEQPFAWNPRTGEGRTLEKTPVHREYRDKSAGEMGTTLDVVGWLPDLETVVVLDFKSGSQVESPAGNWQLLTQAAAAASAFGAARALIVVVYAYEEETLVQQATVFQIADERGERVVESRQQELLQIVARGMRIPAVAIDGIEMNRDEPRPGFNQSPGH